LAFLLALVLAAVFTPILNSIIGRSLNVLSLLTDPFVVSMALLVALALGLLASIYPAIYLSSFKPVDILKGNSSSGRKSFSRSALVVFQFGLAIAMIVSTLVVTRQLNFMQYSDIGLKTDLIVLVDMNGTAYDAFCTLKTELNKSSNILGVTASGQRLGNNFHQWGFKLRTDTAIIDYTPSNVNVDFDYLKVYGIEMADGRAFDESIVTDDGFAFIINETFANDMNLEKPVGMAAGHGFYDNDSLGQIIGVAADFNFNSLHYKINTLAMVVHSDWGYDELSVKVNGENIEAALADIEATWAELVPDWPFQYSFLDEHFEDMYRSDQQLTSVVSIMAFLAIIIAAMGLFGLSSITTERRTKEIGIRKVLGASVFRIVTQSSSRFALLVLIAFLIISPFTYLLLEQWLTSFAYRIDINPILFLLGGMLALAIAMITISYHTVRSALKNPVNTLRYE
jgi:putative ABC transport system permease protein